MAEQQGSKQSTQANQSSIDTDSDWLNDFGGGFDGPVEDLEAAASQPSQSSKPNPTPLIRTKKPSLTARVRIALVP